MTDQPKGELVCKVDEIQLKQALRILIDDYPVAIVKDSMGEIHAIGDTCSHADISLSEVRGDEVYVDFTNILNGAEAPNFS